MMVHDNSKYSTRRMKKGDLPKIDQEKVEISVEKIEATDEFIK